MESKICKHLPNYYREGENTNLLLESINKTFQEWRDELLKTKNKLLIDTASGNGLDVIGSLFGLKRRFGESDENFRERISKFWLSNISFGTEEDIKNIILNTLDISEDDISFKNLTDAKFEVFINIDSFSKTNGEDIVELINDVKAAGIKISVDLEIQNTDYLKSLSDVIEFDDTSNKIYANGHKAGDKNVT